MSPVSLITGASRGIGAATARLLAARGHRVAVNYRDKERRARTVAEAIAADGGAAMTVRADLTDPVAVDRMAVEVRSAYGPVDLLVLNASGGLERGKDPGYAMRLNRDAQVGALDAVRPRRAVFVTSHQAHFVRERPTIAEYAPVAESKRAGEDAVRERAAALGVHLVVVSGDMIEGTVTATLLDRARPGAIEARRAAAGRLLTIGEFAGEIAAAAVGELPDGHTVYAGGGVPSAQPPV